MEMGPVPRRKKIMEKMLGSWLYLNSRERKKGRENNAKQQFSK